jgi:hypothetical protein
MSCVEPATGRLQPSKWGLHCREMVLNSTNMAVLGAIFTFGAAPRPSNLGVKDYGGGTKSLSLCPSTPNCISTGA